MLVPKKLGFVLSALLVGMLTLPVLGQAANGGGGGDNGNGNGNAGGGGGGNGGGGNGGGGFGGRRDPAQFMQGMMDRLKTQLGASDDEFAAIQPKIQSVMTLQRDVNTRPRGMFGRGGPGGRGGFGGGGPTTQPSAVTTAMSDLQTTLDDQNASADTIKSKLDAVRQAKAKARQDLIVAQQDLKSVLTQRQEAVMVLDGYLD